MEERKLQEFWLGGEFRSPANGSGPFSSSSVPLGNVPRAVAAVS